MSKHLLRVELFDGIFAVTVDCPDEALGSARPCAAWANEDGSEREDECTFQNYADAEDLEDWLHGEHSFPPVPIFAAEDGENWHATTDGGQP